MRDKATLSCIMLRSRSVRLVEDAEPFPQRLRSGCKDRVERRLNLLRVDVVIRTSVDESLHRDVEVGLGSLGLYRRHACAVDPLPCPLFRRKQTAPVLSQSVHHIEARLGIVVVAVPQFWV